MGPNNEEQFVEENGEERAEISKRVINGRIRGFWGFSCIGREGVEASETFGAVPTELILRNRGIKLHFCVVFGQNMRKQFRF